MEPYDQQMVDAETDYLSIRWGDKHTRVLNGVVELNQALSEEVPCQRCSNVHVTALGPHQSHVCNFGWILCVSEARNMGS